MGLMSIGLTSKLQFNLSPKSGARGGVIAAIGANVAASTAVTACNIGVKVIICCAFGGAARDAVLSYRHVGFILEMVPPV